MRPTNQETERIRQELKEAGVTAFGLRKFTSRFLPNILHEGEHIKGAVYGRYATGTGLLALVEGMLLATDRRVIFIDRKPGFEAMDELTYDAVFGVQKSYAWPFAAITLHTRIGNYTLRFANMNCIDIFMRYIEKRRLESPKSNANQASISENTPSLIDAKALDFLNNHDIAVLSTIDHTGNTHGAVVHYLVDNHALYILTKAETQKARNIFIHHQVALTMQDEAAMQTLQLQGMAALEVNQAVRDRVLSALRKPRVYGEHITYPPVTTITKGTYVVIRITPYSIRLSEFGQG